MKKIMKYRNKGNALHAMNLFLEEYPELTAVYQYHPKSLQPHWIIRELTEIERKQQR